MEGVCGTEEAGTYSFHPRDTMDILAVVDVGQGIMRYAGVPSGAQAQNAREFAFVVVRLGI